MHKGARVRRDTKCRVGQARNLVVTTSPEVLPFFPLSSDPKRGSCFTLQDSNLQDSLLLQHEQRHETDRNLGNFWKWDVGASTECSLLQSSCSVGTASKQLQMMPTVPRLSSHGPKTGTGAGSPLTLSYWVSMNRSKHTTSRNDECYGRKGAARPA